MKLLRAETKVGHLTYSILSDTIDDRLALGVHVELRTPEGVVEVGEVRDVTVSEGRANVLLALLARGAVTPVSLREIVDDWLADE